MLKSLVLVRGRNMSTCAPLLRFQGSLVDLLISYRFLWMSCRFCSKPSRSCFSEQNNKTVLLASIGVFRQNYTLQMRSIQHFPPFLELGLGRAPDYFATENIIHRHFFRDFAVILHNILVVIGLLLFFFFLMNLFRPGFQSSNVNVPLHRRHSNSQLS